MKLSHLGFFCAVVEHGTVAAAADKLNCVPSNVTIRIRELEEQLGVALFSRERNRLFVTPEGRMLYDKARTLLGLASEAQQLFAGERPVGTLRIGALDVVLNNHLPPRLPAYRSRMPDVELHLHPGYSLALERKLVDGEFDLIVSDGPISHPLLASSLAFRERLKLITPRGIRTLSPKPLAAFEFYVFGKDCHYRRIVDNWLATTGLTPRAVLEIESYPAMFACVAAGHGIACVPDSFLATYRNAYPVNAHALPAADSADIHFVWRKYQASALVTDFIDIVSSKASA
ncbi:LysR family transcriptional regulator [Burkholderia stagnalis]